MKIGALLAHIRELDTHLAAELQSAANGTRTTTTCTTSA